MLDLFKLQAYKKRVLVISSRRHHPGYWRSGTDRLLSVVWIPHRRKEVMRGGKW